MLVSASSLRITVVHYYTEHLHIPAVLGNVWALSELFHIHECLTSLEPPLAFEVLFHWIISVTK